MQPLSEHKSWSIPSPEENRKLKGVECAIFLSVSKGYLQSVRQKIIRDNAYAFRVANVKSTQFACGTWTWDFQCVTISMYSCFQENSAPIYLTPCGPLVHIFWIAIYTHWQKNYSCLLWLVIVNYSQAILDRLTEAQVV